MVGIDQHFTPHGFRYTFNDLARQLAGDPLIIRSLTGHVTEDMRAHYSHVRPNERLALACQMSRLVLPNSVNLTGQTATEIGMVNPTTKAASGGKSGSGGGNSHLEAPARSGTVGKKANGFAERDTRFELATFTLGIRSEHQ